ncbi:MAG: TonB-dependent receptor [Deltaproteobacteria bacterium]|jgi:vitamin B12 transporter|nr:TonB-dependent receptor [Deltaproteobacteria bacterium]
MASVGLAQSQSAPSSGESLNTVVVTSSRTPEKLREVSSHVSVISEEELAVIPYDNLMGILRHEGIHVRDYPGQATASVDIRGFRTATVGDDGGLGGRVLLLVDGRPAGTGNIFRIFKTNVESIEIIRGPAAVQYGTAAMGGVINVITKRGQGDVKGKVKFGFGSYSYNDQMIESDFRKGPVDFSVGLFRTEMDDIKDAHGRQLYNTANEGIYGGSLNLGYNFLDDRQRLGLTVGFYDNDFQGVGGGHSYGPITKADLGGSNVVNKNTSFDLIYTGTTEKENISWQTRYYHLTDKYEWYELAKRDGKAGSITDTKMDGVQGQIKGVTKNFEVTAGIDYLKYDTDRYSSWDTPGRELKNYKLTTFGGYLLTKLKFLEDSLIFNAGVRYDNFKNNASGNNVSEHNVSPSVGVVYLPLEFLKFRANYSKGFRAPTPTELAQDYDSWGTRYLGNPDLNPEKSDTYEFGVDLDLDYFTANATYFYTKYKNEIRSGRRLPPNISTYYNADESTYSGLELGASFFWGAFLKQDFELETYFKATIYDKRETSLPNGDKHAALYMPNTFSGGVTFTYPSIELTSNFNVAYFAKAWEQNFGNNYPGKTYVKAPAYTIADFSVSKTLFHINDTNKVVMDFAIRNLFDEYYEPILDYAAPGRSFYVGLTYKYN